jgi:hypothetical protein
MRYAFLVLLGSGLSLAACGGSVEENRVEGLGDVPFEVRSAAFIHRGAEAGDEEQLAIVMTDQEDACALVESGQIHLEIFESGPEGRLKNAAVLSILVFGAPDIPLGSIANVTEHGGSGAASFVQFSKSGASCEELTPGSGSRAGAVTLESFDAKEGGVATGSFDVDIGPHDVIGHFRATYCPTADKSAPRECR